MSAARDVKDPRARGEKLRPEGRVRARTGAPTRNGRVFEDLQRGARSARRRANEEAVDALTAARRRTPKEADE